MAFNLYQAILDNINPQAKKQFAEVGQQIKKSVAPITQFGQGIAQQSKQALQPTTNRIGAIGSGIVTPVKEVYSRGVENSGKSKQIADYLKTKGITADIIKQMAEDEGTDPTEAFKFFKDIGVELEGINKYRVDAMKAKEQARLDARPLWQKGGEKLATAGLGAFTTVGSSALNLTGWADKKLGDVTGAVGLDTISEKLKTGGQELQDTAQEWKQSGQQFAKDTNLENSYLAGNIAGGTAMLALAPSPTSLAGQSAGIGTKIGLGATEGALQSASMDIAKKGETSLGSLTTGAAVGGAFPIVGQGAKKIKQLVTDRLPKSIVASGLMTPSKLLNSSERLSRLADDGMVNIDDAPKWMLDKGIQGSKETIQKQLGDISRNATKQKVQLFANDAVDGVQKTYEASPVVQELQQALTEVLPNFAQVTKNAIIPKAGNKQKVEALLEFITKPKPTALDIDKARAVLGDMGIFTKGGELADTATKEGLQRIWIQASKLLDDSLPGFRALNKDIEVAHAMRNAIGLKEAQDSVRQLVSLTNISLGGAGAAYGYAQEGDLTGALKYAGAGLAGKYLLNNPAVTTFVAQKLNAMGKLKGGVSQKLKPAQKVIKPAIIELTKSLGQ